MGDGNLLDFMNVEESVRGLETLKQRVYELYLNHQELVDSDRLLIDFYVTVFGRDVPEESITRTGRYWRASEKFIRSPAAKKKSMVMQQAHKQVFG